VSQRAFEYWLQAPLLSTGIGGIERSLVSSAIDPARPFADS